MSRLTSAFKCSLPVIKKRLGTLLLVTAWPYAVTAICFMVAGVVFRAQPDSSPESDPLRLWYSLGALEKVGVVLAYMASISLPHSFATVGATAVVWADFRGETVDLRSVGASIGRVCLRLIVLSFIIGAIWVFGGIFLLLPGILGFAFMSFVIPVLVIENASVGTALRRGLDLASKRVGALLGLYAIALVVVSAVGVIGLIVADSLASVVTVPWWATVLEFWIVVGVTASTLIMGITAVVVRFYRDLSEPTGVLVATEPPM